MHIDSRNLEDHTLIDGDICIIGAGAAGISIAQEWINTPYKIILLEGGGLDYDEQVQELYRGKNLGQRYYPLMASRLHMFGGTTGHWAGFCAKFDPIDFKARPWVEHSGWPMSYEEFSSYYERAHSIIDLETSDFSLEYWLQRSPDREPFPLDQRFIRNKIWQFSSPATRFKKKFLKSILEASNIHLFTYANAVDIQASEDLSMVKEISVTNHTGKMQKVRAKFFVLACNSIQNPRLLLSSNKQMAAGLGNQHDWVGRCFMEHIQMKAAELWVTNRGFYPLYTTNTTPTAGIGLTEEKQEEYEVLNGTMSLVPLHIAEKRIAAIDAWSDDDPRVSEKQIHESNARAEDGILAKMFNSGYVAFQVLINMEQSPNPDSRVTIDPLDADELGLPRAALSWQLTSLEKKSIKKMLVIFGSQMGSAGIGRLKLLDYIENDSTWPPYTSGGWHHMGTTRMSDNPRNGVVDQNCRVHGFENFFIAGASCFPTSGVANPTLGLIALSLRLSDHLKDQLRIKPF